MTATGHDGRFRRLYAREAGPRLARLGGWTLQLERDGTDPRLVEEMFRDAHSLKGGALVVGLPAVAEVAHALEDVLDALRSGTARPTPSVIDALLAALDAFPALLDSGDDGAADRLAARLRAELSADAAVTLPAAPAEPRPDAPESGEDTVLRVPIARLERLGSLADAAVAAQRRLAGALTEAGVGELDELDELEAALGQLRDQTLRTRMVPLAAVLEPLSRMVRETARSLGKQVRYELHGGDIELDLGVLRMLVDPVLHLIRNAVDHGIEPPDERAAAGKDAVGTIRLTALQRGREVVLTFTDDGRGVDVDRVRARAGAQGRDTGALSDGETVALVFASGLSTADAVTQMSGRGVGLDVVNDVARRIHGRVEVRSTRDEGTEFRLTVPLTLAGLPCWLLEAGSRTFALPLPAVTAVLPAGLGPGVPTRLSAILGLEDSGGAGLDVVVADGERTAVLCVDRLGPQRDVVLRGLSPLLPPLDIVAGVTTDSRGTVLVVLDPAGLLDRVGVDRRSR